MMGFLGLVRSQDLVEASKRPEVRSWLVQVTYHGLSPAREALKPFRRDARMLQLSTRTASKAR